ncbi:GGDEF domain-containing protein [Chrysiogenes arsenatis]|uniref:GGDEF domain-containing protein n=1 Tax=Chrysiogenes arsenatis TaxID=309797 RepID=UPI0004140E71|nr:diguanylate cyclase [Chrysiogenes arsenatis]
MSHKFTVPFLHSITVRAVAYLCVCGFTLFSASFFVYLQLQENMTEERLVLHGKSFLDMLLKNTEDSINKGQRNTFQRVIDSFTKVNEIESVAMYGRNGLMNYHSNYVTVGKPFILRDGVLENPNVHLYESTQGRYQRNDWYLRDVHQTPQAREHIAQHNKAGRSCGQCHVLRDTDLRFREHFSYRIEKNQSHFYYELPVMSDCTRCHLNWKNGEIASWIRVTLNNDVIIDQKNENILSILVLSFMVSFPALILVILILHYVIKKPLSRTLQFAIDVANGKARNKLTEDGTNEISRLNQALNQMMMKIDSDFTRIMEAEEKLRMIANTDGLTGIPNRRHFDETLQKECARLARHYGVLSLIMIDIDYFKNFNDAYGHIAGDTCLQQIARILQESVHRAGDVVARYGGEEFACILPETDKTGAMAVATFIQQKIAALAIPHRHSQVADVITVSIGIISIPCHPNLLPGDIIGLADKQLYQAKHKGRNCISAHGER